MSWPEFYFNNANLVFYTRMKIYIKYLTCLSFLLLSMTNVTRHPSFKQYRVGLFKGHKAKPILKSNRLGEMFKTVITHTYYSKDDMRQWHGTTGLNFGGHYCFAYWGCGSPCQMAVIVDLKTGIIYDAPAGSFGYEFRANSRLVVVNPDIPCTGCSGFTTEYWVLDELSQKFVQMH